MVIYQDVILFIITIVVLFICTYWLLRSLGVITKFLRLSEFVAGFIFLAIGTSLPELVIGITSALEGVSSLSLGNVIGANILDITLVIGIPVILVRGIKLNKNVVKTDSYIMFGMAILPLALTFIGRQLSRIDGAILVLSFVLYIIWILKQKNSFTKKLKDHIPRKIVALNFVIFFISLFVLIKSADYTILFAEKIAIFLDLPKIFIGIFIISMGTSLPELITATRAALTGYKEIIAGTIMGSVITNSSLILGVVAIINPISVNFAYFGISSLFLLFFCFMFLVFVSSEKKLDFKEGIALVMMYVVFLLIMLSVKGVL